MPVWGQPLLSGANFWLISLCAVVWGVTAIAPVDVSAWAMEQVATILALLLLWWAARRVSFSVASRIGFAGLFIAHAIGTHFTYSLTPYDALVQYHFGFSIDHLLGWERNNYDRFVHVLFGVALALPFSEFFRSCFNITPIAAKLLAVNFVISASAIYELMEWLAAVVLASDVGMAYLGAQGDIWDAQWDIALAMLGCCAVFALSWVRKGLRLV